MAVIQNNLRGLYVELMVAELLGPPWRHNGTDWAAYDLEHTNGTRLEVKQSAAQQTWAAPSTGRSVRSFSIRVPKIEWVGSKATTRNNRVAGIYVFAWHDGLIAQSDQRDPKQWKFFVVPARLLPNQQTICLGPLNKLAKPVGANQLRATVHALFTEGFMQ